MKTIINNLSEKNLKAISEQLGGKLWMKNDLTRIYVNGGNNYQYSGKWYYEIAVDGEWESKVFLENGYNNKNREGYVSKYLAEMDDNMNAALKDQQNSAPQNSAPQNSAPQNSAPQNSDPQSVNTDTVDESRYNEVGQMINFGKKEEQRDHYPVNFYDGCGSYYLAFNESGVIVASINFSVESGNADRDLERLFKDLLLGKGAPVDRISLADGSGCTFFFRNGKDAERAGVKTKVYSVPSASGGWHENIELVLS